MMLDYHGAGLILLDDPRCVSLLDKPPYYTQKSNWVIEQTHAYYQGISAFRNLGQIGRGTACVVRSAKFAANLIS